MSIECEVSGPQTTDDEFRIVELDQANVADDAVAGFSWVCWVDVFSRELAEA